jgi:6-phosphogluconate dehydrogenase
MEANLYDVGMVGLGVMGRNLVLNLADHGARVAGYDKDLSKGEVLCREAGNSPVAAAANVAEFVALLRPPRVVMLLVAPASVVDIVLRDLLPHLGAGDLVIDAGNSHFRDTDRRAQQAAEKGVRFFGMGVSGGEAGARRGASLMPGGPKDAYERVRPLLESVAARVDGEPCVTWLGPGSAGHYVKMVHNGIEYGVMQLLAESYDLMKRGLGLGNDELAEAYERWNQGELNSFLVEITARIFRQPDDRTPSRLVDMILDVAGQKGTGQWTSEEALALQVPVPTLDAAVTMRNLSGREAARHAAHEAHGGPVRPYKGQRVNFLDELANALSAGVLLCYAQGMDLLRQASESYHYQLNLAEVARIWRGGCIIRAALLDDVRAAFAARPDLPHLIADPRLAERLRARAGDLRVVVRAAAEMGLPVPGLMASLGYHDALRAGWLPANLIQAHRDLFGAHTYRRRDVPGSFHTHWADA